MVAKKSAQKGEPRQAIIEAMLELAADKKWRDISLNNIAAEAGVSLGDLSRHFATKTSIVAGFMANVDARLLDGLGKLSKVDTPRDRLFDVLMQRFDLLELHKAALKNITSGVRRDPVAMARLVCPALRTQHLMMAGAGVTVTGVSGLVKHVGLAGVYGSVFCTWLKDDDPGLAKTMAALDRALRRGEGLLARTELPLMLGQAVCDFARGWRKARRNRPARDDTMKQAPEDPGLKGAT